LKAEVEKQTKVPGTDIVCAQWVVLDLAETDYIDSSGLGALVRLLAVLRAAGGALKLCQLSPQVRKVIEITNLVSLFPIHESEDQAIEAFSVAPSTPADRLGRSQATIVCVDTSSDLRAALNALLTGSGYEVLTTHYVGDAATLVKATKPRLVICGPGMMASPAGRGALDRFRQYGPSVHILELPPDFHTAEAGEAGEDLLRQVQSLVAS